MGQNKVIELFVTKQELSVEASKLKEGLRMLAICSDYITLVSSTCKYTNETLIDYYNDSIRKITRFCNRKTICELFGDDCFQR